MQQPLLYYQNNLLGMINLLEVQPPISFHDNICKRPVFTTLRFIKSFPTSLSSPPPFSISTLFSEKNSINTSLLFFIIHPSK
jgi:hypothetical protein